MTNILRTFTASLRKKYDNMPVDEKNTRILMTNITRTLPCDANLALDAPVTKEELLHAVKRGKPNKAPGSDGVCQDFFMLMWNLIKTEMLPILNQMYVEGEMTDKQKHGTIICIPKTPHPRRPDEYRPLTLLNADYKLLARVIANRMNPWLDPFLHPSQHCGISGHTIFEAIANIRDAILRIDTVYSAIRLPGNIR
jgi:hypothetical protein